MQDDARVAAIYKAVGQKVAAKRRNSLKVTQAKLSELTRGRLSRSAIANIENGRQRVAVHHLYDLAEAFNSEPGDFIPSAQEIFELPENLIASIKGDPHASEFTRRVLGLSELNDITFSQPDKEQKK